jgi:hypothetical protein
MHIESLQIEPLAVKELLLPHWQNLISIILFDNNIGVEECLVLSKANWPRIKMIDLSNNIFTKETIK